MATANVKHQDRQRAKAGMRFYKSYSFKDRDPVIDELRTIVADEGASFGDVNRWSGVSTTTLYNWFGVKAKTKRPQSACVEAVGRSLGYKRVWKRFKRTPVKAKSNGHG